MAKEDGGRRYPQGTLRQRRLDWAGSVMVMVGAAVAALAVIFIHQVWLWPVVGVLVVVGVGVWLKGGLDSSSARGRISRPQSDDRSTDD